MRLVVSKSYKGDTLVMWNPENGKEYFLSVEAGDHIIKNTSWDKKAKLYEYPENKTT